MPRPKYLINALANGNVREIAEALHRYHAPSVELRITLFAKESVYDYEVKDSKFIVWYVGDGLHTLLHEFGHHALRHVKDTCCDYYDNYLEAEAWLWAEKWAHKHGIFFNYLDADKAFDKHHEGRPSVMINWKGSNGESTPQAQASSTQGC